MKLSFKALARFVAGKPKTVIALSLAATVALGAGMSRLSVDADMTDDIPNTVPEKAFYDEVGKIFPSDDFLIVAFSDSRGAFAPEMLKQTKEWTETIKGVEGVKNVISISSAGIIKGTDAGLVIEEAMPKLPESPAELEAFKRRIEDSSMTKSLIGADGKSTSILITLKGGIDATKIPRVRLFGPSASAANGNSAASGAELLNAKAYPTATRVLRADSEADRKEAFLRYRENLDPAKKGHAAALLVPADGVDFASFSASVSAAAKTAGWKAKAIDTPVTGYERVTAALESLPKYADGKTYVSGSKAVSSIVGRLLIQDLALLFPIVVLIIAVILFISFRTLRGVLLPLGNVVLSVVWAMGLMGHLGQAITMATMILPIILIAVGTAYTIHVINRFYEDLATHADKRDAIEATVGNVAVPVFLAGITTVIGFGSLATSSLLPMRMFGVLSALGIFFALVLSLTFTPALMALLPAPKPRTVTAHQTSRLAEFLGVVGRFVANRARTVVAAAAVVLALFAVFVPRVGFETNTINSFKEGSEIRQASEYLNENFTGITVMTVIVRTDQEGAILDPAVLKAMDGLQARLESLRLYKGIVVAPEDKRWKDGKAVVGGSQSIVTFVKGINKALNADDPAFDKVPDEFTPVPVGTERYTLKNGILEERDSETKELLAAYKRGDFKTADGTASIVLNGTERRIDTETGSAVDLIPGRDYAGQLVFQYENSGKPENIEGFIDNPRQTARMNVFIKTASSTLIGQIQAFARENIAANFPKGSRADITGLSNLTLAIMRLLVDSQISSVISSLIVVFLFVSLLSRSLIEGFFSIVPLSASLIINFGIMGLFGIPIDISTATIASIGIGIGIDYTLHFMERLKAMVVSMDLKRAIEATMRTTGKGIFFNALAVAGGFSALLFSQLKGNFFMGLLMSLIMLTSSFFAVTLLPSLLMLFNPKFLQRRTI